MNKPIQQELASVFENISVVVSEDNRMIVTVQKDQVMSILHFLKNKGFDHLALVSCVDWIEEKEFEMVYILTPYLREPDSDTDMKKLHITVKCRIRRKEPRVMTVIPIFDNAEPYEREIHELFGVYFDGHPRLIPLFLEGKYETPPFRKDFDTREYVKEVYDTVPFVDDEKT